MKSLSQLGLLLSLAAACSSPDDVSVDDPTTVEHTLGNPHVASNVEYSNATSGLPATDVQRAIDVLAARPSVGAPGPQGPSGPAGAVGPAGPAGLQGVPGADGLAVTSQVVLFGDPNCPTGGTRFETFSGTTYACNGLTGVPGLAGPVGPQGVPGSAGATGPRGADGVQGPPGPAGSGGGSDIKLAPDGWAAVSPIDGRFVGIGTRGRDMVAWVAAPGAFQTSLLIRDPSPPGQGTPLRAVVGYATRSLSNQQALFVQYASAGGGSAASATFDGSVIREYSLDPAELGRVRNLSVGLPADSMFAPAGIDAANALGGYLPGRDNFFVVSGRTLTVATFTGSTSVPIIDDLDALFAMIKDVPNVACLPRYVGIAHDPQSQRVAIADACNRLVWVLGYDAAGAALTVRGVIRPPSMGALGYEPARHLLWVGTFGVSVDLATFTTPLATGPAPGGGGGA